MVMGIEFDRHAGRHREGLMHGAAMRHFEKPLALFGRDAVRQVNRQCDLAHPMRLFRHDPFRLNTQPFGRNLVAVAEATREIPDTTGYDLPLVLTCQIRRLAVSLRSTWS
jgi:hypothetical protein